MLSTFSVTPRGFIPVTQKQSCLPCRRKKKRCDGVRPKCGLCRDSYGRDECMWPSARRTRKQQSNSPENNSPKCSAPITITPKVSIASGSCEVTLPDKFLEGLPHLSPETILEASHTFQQRVLCNHPAYQGSVMALSLPLAIQHEPLLHAWISSILLSMPDGATRWWQESVIHYNHAVRGLKTSVLIGSPSEEWKRATAMLCHAIELLQPVPSAQLARSHLSAAHHMFQPTIGDSKPTISEHDALLFEAYIIRTATNCLFQQDIHKHLPFDYVEKLSAIHIGALERRSLTMSPENCPWLSSYGQQTMDFVYKVSWIYAQDSSASFGCREAVEVWRGLENMEDSNTDQHSDCKITTRVYRMACQALLRPFLPNNHPEGSRFDNELLVPVGLRDVEALSLASSGDVTMLWPLIILGAMATSRYHQNQCSAMIMQFGTTASTHAVESIMSFLTEAWKIKDVRLQFKDTKTLRSILL